MRVNRQGIIIWFQRRRNIKQIKRYGHMIYASKKWKYAVVYVDQEHLDDVIAKLNNLPFIKKVQHSHKPYVRTNFENKTPDEAKRYDYNIGI